MKPYDAEKTERELARILIFIMMLIVLGVIGYIKLWESTPIDTVESLLGPPQTISSQGPL